MDDTIKCPPEKVINSDSRYENGHDVSKSNGNLNEETAGHAVASIAELAAAARTAVIPSCLRNKTEKKWRISKSGRTPAKRLRWAGFEDANDADDPMPDAQKATEITHDEIAPGSTHEIVLFRKRARPKKSTQRADGLPLDEPKLVATTDVTNSTETTLTDGDDVEYTGCSVRAAGLMTTQSESRPFETTLAYRSTRRASLRPRTQFLSPKCQQPTSREGENAHGGDGSGGYHDEGNRTPEPQGIRGIIVQQLRVLKSMESNFLTIFYDTYSAYIAVNGVFKPETCDREV